jgi:hypothetical protein
MSCARLLCIGSPGHSCPTSGLISSGVCRLIARRRKIGAVVQLRIPHSGTTKARIFLPSEPSDRVCLQTLKVGNRSDAGFDLPRPPSVPWAW